MRAPVHRTPFNPMMDSGTQLQFPLTQAAKIVCFYHDVEQNCDWNVDVGQCRQIVKDLVDMEHAHGVKATYNVVGRLCDEQHDLIDWIHGGGHEVGFHSYHHQSNWRPDFYAEEVKRCRQKYPHVRGYRSPQSRWDWHTLQSCSDEGFAWNAEADRAPLPYFIHRELVRIPITADDWPLHTGKMTLQQWHARFSTLLNQRQFLVFGSHDCVLSVETEARLACWEKLLQEAIDAGARCVTFSEAMTLARPTLSMQLSRTWKRIFRAA